MQDDNLNDFCSLYNFKNLIKEPTVIRILQILPALTLSSLIDQTHSKIQMS